VWEQNKVWIVLDPWIVRSAHTAPWFAGTDIFFIRCFLCSFLKKSQIGQRSSSRSIGIGDRYSDPVFYIPHVLLPERSLALALEEGSGQLERVELVRKVLQAREELLRGRLLRVLRRIAGRIIGLKTGKKRKRRTSP
jgi:hypothetical protein